MPQAETAFLDVENSLSGRRWTPRMSFAQSGEAERLEREARQPPLLARVLAARSVDVAGVEKFLNPTLRDLMTDPSTLTDMDAAVDRLFTAIERKERVAIFGDYDVDGAASSALIDMFLRACGCETEIYIPDRVFEGYGPNPTAIRDLLDRGANLIVTVDCGANSAEPLELATGAGTDVVVLDHHQTGDVLPAVTAIVNPNRQDDLSGLGHLCAAGVVFFTLVALQRKLRDTGREGPDLMAGLDLVAMATICDVVPLIGVNRAFVKRGLELMHGGGREGLFALARVAGLKGPPAPWHMGFLLGPRINAGGRIGDAALGARLLTTDDPAEAEKIAIRLDTLNGERQAMEAVMLKEAMAEADAEIADGSGPGVVVTASDTWHAGVVGLLASRLKDRFRRPAFAVAFDDRNIGSGSARSIAGIDIGAAVRAAVDEGLLSRGGGHAMAAGITIERDKLGAFRGWLEERLGDAVRNTAARDTLKVDGALSARGATPELFAALQKAGPFGAGNPQPVVALPNHTLTSVGVVGQNHLRISLRASDGGKIGGVAFRAADAPLGQELLQMQGERVHVAGTLSSDNFRGTERVELRLLDAALPEA